jgi:tetratricopeptide (TPR) repeat protein
MGPSGKALTAALLWGVLAAPLLADDSDPLLKAVAKDAGKMSPSEQKLFSSSIQSTKESIARETLDVFYRDALDYYHQGKYSEALEVLDKIYSIDPYYEDVGTLRETITRLRDSHDIESKKGILQDFMRKGNAAQAAGHTIQAIAFWKQALTVNASYEPAKKKIQEANHAMAQKQYESGYLYYHHGDYDYALDSWSNAIALDPTYKQRGLLLLMSKVQILQQKDKIAKLAAQGSQQYASQDLTGALQTYQDLLSLDERNEEARRMSAKIKIQLGQAAFTSAQDSLSKGLYAQAIKQWQDSIKYEYEVQRSQKWIQEAEHRIQGDREAKLAASKPKPAAPPKAATEVSAQPVAPAVPQCPPPAGNAEEASGHYRDGLTAIRSKDFHHALEELEIASKLNPCDEHIYVAKERARQEWSNASSNRM